jgi:hypothetical protein
MDWYRELMDYIASLNGWSKGIAFNQPCFGIAGLCNRRIDDVVQGRM